MKEMKETEEIVEQLNTWKNTYYNKTPIVGDLEFDALEDHLRKLDPDNDYFKTAGYATQGNKIMHKRPMISMNKAKTIEELIKWSDKISPNENIEYIAELKYDGNSCSITYINGKIKYITTRGDGVEGQDITHIKNFVKSIPHEISIKNEIEIRGELVLPINTKMPNPGNKALRNLVSGLINRKNDYEDLKYVDFIAYQIFGEKSKTEHSKLHYLENLGFIPSNYWGPFTKDDFEIMYKEYLEAKEIDDFLYDNDGLVFSVNDCNLHDKINSNWVVDHHNHYNICIKPPSQKAVTILRDIKWQMGRSGVLTPVGEVDPIELAGATIKNVTLNNLRNVINLKLHKGDSVLISRAGDVIPFFEKNLTEHKQTDWDLFPVYCPFCNSDTVDDTVRLYCNNNKCSEKLIQQIIFWVKSCKMDNVSEATVRTLWNNNLIDSISSLYSLLYEDIFVLEGFQKKSTDNLLNQIEKTKEMTIVEFISRIGIPLVGKKALKKLNINSIEDFIKFNDSRYVIGQNIIEWKKNQDNMYILYDLLEVINIIKEKEEVKGMNKIAMTGKGPMKRDDLIAEIEAKGYEFVKSVTKETDILICEDVSGNSTKLQKARKQGISLVSYEEFFENHGY